MSTEIKLAIQAVKLAKATRVYWLGVKAYGGEWQALRAYDSLNRDEAIKMLSVVQKVSVFKREGRVVIQ